MVVPKNLTITFTKDLPLDTQDDIANTTLTGTVFYNFASDSLDTKIDAQLSYANYQNDSDRLTTNTYLTLQPTKCIKITKRLDQNPTNFNILPQK
jgi:hypothetical protein